MARFTHGINGPFVGKVGTVIGSSWKGEPYMKSLSKNKTKKKGPNESANQDKLATAHRWLQPLLEFVRQGFKGYTPRIEGYNAAKSYNLLHAFDDADGKKVFNPAKALVSFGDLRMPDNIRMERNGDLLQFYWDPGDRAVVNEYDQAMLLFYDDANRDCEMKLTGQFRYTGGDSLNIKGYKAGSNCHVYIAFVAADRSRQSKSVYLGVVEI